MADLSSRERVLPTLRREVQDVNLTMAAEVAPRGVSIVHTGDDFAGDTGPLMSPTHFRSLFHPDSSVRPENYMAMPRALREHGRY